MFFKYLSICTICPTVLDSGPKAGTTAQGMRHLSFSYWPYGGSIPPLLVQGHVEVPRLYIYIQMPLLTVSFLDGRVPLQ